MAGMAWASTSGGAARRDHELSRRSPLRSHERPRPRSQDRTAGQARPQGLTGIGQTRSIIASQAWAPFWSIVTANIAGSMALIDQPSTKAARSWALDARRGPQSPGWRSLKHIM